MDDKQRVDPVDRLAAEIRAAFVRPPADEVRERHLMAMREVEPVPAPAKRLGRRRQRAVVRGAIAAAGLVLVGGSALAATGSLPDPVQDAVSAAANAVGIDIPAGHTNLPSNERAAHNKQDAVEFVAAQRAWVACMKAAKASPTPEATATGTTATTTPEEACGAKPKPSDFREPGAEKTARPEKTAMPSKAPKDNPSADNPSADNRPEKTDLPGPPVMTPKGNPSDDRPVKTPNPNKGGPTAADPDA